MKDRRVAADFGPYAVYVLSINMPEEPNKLTQADAIVVRDGEMDAATANSRWAALFTFHKAPCLKPSLGAGAIGGTFLGALRYMTGAGGKTAFTWGSVVAGLLAGTSWFTCRRAMYQGARQEVDLLERVQQGDADALLQYQELLEARAEKTRLELESRNAERK